LPRANINGRDPASAVMVGSSQLRKSCSSLSSQWNASPVWTRNSVVFQSISLFSARIRATSSCVSVTTLKDTVGLRGSRVVKRPTGASVDNPLSGQYAFSLTTRVETG